jgi:hypothetical protein
MLAQCQKKQDHSRARKAAAIERLRHGRMTVFRVEPPRQLGWQGAFHIPADGGPIELVVGREYFDMHNGLS